MAPELFGPYQLQELIGQGGMGEVHRAFDTVRQRTVALKRLRPEYVADERFRARFLRECQRVARLAEAHVVPIHDYGEINSRLYLDMRLIEGDNLADVLATDGPLSPEHAVDVVAQVAAALDTAHAAGLIHRDVKPSNVLLGGNGAGPHCYLADFGVAGAVGGSGGSLTPIGTIVGTLDYIAPERLLGTSPDHRVDVYSLACLLHEALTGSPPFRGDELPAMIHAHLNLEPPRASELVPTVPKGFDAVIAHGMAKDPDTRYASAGELAAAARAALRREPAALPAVPPAATSRTTVAADLTQAVAAVARARPSTPPVRHAWWAGFAPRLLLLAVLVFAGGFVTGGVMLLDSAAATDVRREPAPDPGDNPFAPPPGAAEAGRPPVPPPEGILRGDSPGLYAGTRNTTCDTEHLAAFLEAHPDRAAAWAAVQGIQPTEIRPFLAALTPVTLRTDTAVTNHGFADGRATPFQSVLQAGAAVVVDERGVPRVRCHCGNPLAPPAPRTAARYEGAAWSGFSSETVTAIEPAPAPVEEFFVVRQDTDDVLARPRATRGEQDRPANPAAAEAARTFSTSAEQADRGPPSSAVVPDPPTETGSSETDPPS